MSHWTKRLQRVFAPALIGVAVGAVGAIGVRAASQRWQRHLEQRSRITCVRDGEASLGLADSSEFATCASKPDGCSYDTDRWRPLPLSLHEAFSSWAAERGVHPLDIPPSPAVVEIAGRFWVVNSSLYSSHGGTAIFQTVTGNEVKFPLDVLLERTRTSEARIGDLDEVNLFRQADKMKWLLGVDPNFAKDPSWSKWLRGRKVRVKKIVVKYALKVKERFPVMENTQANYMTVRRHVQSLLEADRSVRSVDAAAYTDLITAYSFVPTREQIMAADLFNSNALGSAIAQGLIGGRG